MLSVRPTHPMTRTNIALSTVVVPRNLSTDWKKMLTPKATKKAPLKKAPITGARCHPNVYGPLSDFFRSLTYVPDTIRNGHLFHDIWWRLNGELTMMAARATAKPIRSFN